MGGTFNAIQGAVALKYAGFEEQVLPPGALFTAFLAAGRRVPRSIHPPEHSYFVGKSPFATLRVCDTEVMKKFSSSTPRFPVVFKPAIELTAT